MPVIAVEVLFVIAAIYFTPYYILSLFVTSDNVSLLQILEAISTTTATTSTAAAVIAEGQQKPCNIRLILPSGAKSKETFAEGADTTLSLLLSRVLVRLCLSAADGHRRFELLSGYPPRPLSTRLEELLLSAGTGANTDTADTDTDTDTTGSDAAAAAAAAGNGASHKGSNGAPAAASGRPTGGVIARSLHQKVSDLGLNNESVTVRYV